MEDVIKQVKSILDTAFNDINNLLIQSDEALIKSDYILSGLCDFFKIERSELTNPRRKRELIIRRMLAVYLLRNHTNLTLQQIATLLNYKNHATVIHHIREANNMLSQNFDSYDDFKRTYKQVVKLLKLQNNDSKH